MGTQSPNAVFFGHPFVHPLAEPYFNQAPLRFGDYVAKIGLFPADSGRAALADYTIDTSEDDNAFRSTVVDYFAEQGARFELREQLWNNTESQPIEGAPVEWSTADVSSPAGAFGRTRAIPHASSMPSTE